MIIIKRDGTSQNFDKNKIVIAVEKAFKSVDGKVTDYAEEKAHNIANYIETLALKREVPFSIEEIQDLVEHGLMSLKHKAVAREYITYREKRNIQRTRNSDLRKRVMEKLTASNVQNQNANVDEYSFGGRVGEASDEQARDIALNDIISPMAKENHVNNRIYIHDLNSYAVGMHNCLSIPFDHLLAEGFNTRQTDIRPANSINTACQLTAVLFQVQSLQQFGGCSATHYDWTMVPYVRKSFWKHFKDGMAYIYTPPHEYIGGTGWTKHIEEMEKWVGQQKELNAPIETGKEIDCHNVYRYAIDMTTKELKQAIEGLYHNLNSLQSRSGNQLPFSSINYGTCTLPEGRMVIKALLEGSLKGIGKLHRTSIFPCGIFQVGEGINKRPGDPNYDLFRLALKSTAKRLYPNYVNLDWSGNAGYDPNRPDTYMATMGCRTMNGYDINGFGQQKDGRGNICPVTIILPTLAMEAIEGKGLAKYLTIDDWKEDRINAFLKILDKAIDDAKDMLLERFAYIASQSPASAKFMWENRTMAGYIPEEGIISALKHGTLAVGQLGLAECLQILIQHDHTTNEGMAAAKRIEQLFKDKCAKFKEEYKLNFGVYYSPAENLCYTAMKKFKAKYGEMPNVSDREFFTNSIHVPVWKNMTAAQKIDIESQLTSYSSAGCITYVEMDGRADNNIDALEKIVVYAMDKDIPYFAINVPNDTCMECGFTDEIGNTCPKCGSSNIQRLRRVTGYLTGDYKSAFNAGKIQETNMRVKHQLPEV